MPTSVLHRFARPWTGLHRTATLRTLAVIALAGALGIVPRVAEAQLSTSRGWSFGAQVQGTSLTIEDDDPRSGGGLALRAGYGFNRRLTLFLAVDGGQVDIPENGELLGEWELTHGEIGARFHFANSLRRWVPYLEASVGARSFRVNDARVEGGPTVDRISFNGGVLSVGGGLSVFLSRSVALDATLRFSGGSFNEVASEELAIRNLDFSASSTRFGVGIVWWP